ncbi:MAG: hypothetical protein ACKVQJ_00255 [Pyrinomonadaceae bacterium]
MTVTLELEPEVESRVRSKAKSLGKSVENFLVEVIDENVPDDSVKKSFFQTATDEEWEAAMDSMAEFSDKIPLTWDDSRESIYR